MSRREFMHRALALGIGVPTALMLVNAVNPHSTSGQEPGSGRPTFGTEEQVRGAGGEFTVRQWMSPSSAFAHISGFPPSAAEVSSLILEPLFSYAADGSLLPTLANEVPTRENGGLSSDLTRVTVNLREGLQWSDGEPFTSADVVWTWHWVSDETNGAVSRGIWSDVLSVEATAPLSVQFVFSKPTLKWFAPLAGAYMGAIIPAHVWRNGDAAKVNAAFALDPVGTGPYRVTEFAQGDSIRCTINERYREPNKPYFSAIHFQGGGDSAAAAQAVLLTGDWDVATGLAMKPGVLREMEETGDKGRLIAGIPVDVERIMFNFADPNREIDGERFSLQGPHPFLTDRAVREAMALAIDRESIASEIFQADDLVPAARNILTGIPLLESPNTSFAFSVEAASDLLDGAGWVREGEVRIKDGIELKVAYQTLVIDDFNQLMRFRPELQAAIKSSWEAIGIKVHLGQVAGEIFFDTSPENERSYAHFYQDVQMYATGPDSPVPDTLFAEWYAGPNNSNVAQRANDWTGGNTQRYVNPRFDLLFEEASSTTDPERAVELFIQMNDMLIGDFVVVPLHARSIAVHALSNRLAVDNVAASAWEPIFWNIANWRTLE